MCYVTHPGLVKKNAIKHDVSSLFCSRAPLYVNPDHAPRATILCTREPIRLKFENMAPVYVKSRGPKIVTKSEPNILKKIIAK